MHAAKRWVIRAGLIAQILLPCFLAAQNAAAPQANAPAAAQTKSPNPVELQKLQNALADARSKGDAKQEAQTLKLLGNLYSDVADSRTALGFYEQALPIFQRLGDYDGEGRTLNNIGNVHRAQGEKQKAIDLYEKALSLVTQAGDIPIEFTVLQNTAIAYSQMGEQQKALDDATRALALMKQTGDKKSQDAALTLIGSIDETLGRKADALAAYDQALSIEHESGDQSAEALTMMSMGSLDIDLNKQKAPDLFLQALQLFRKLADRPNEASALNNLGIAYYDLGEHQKAIDFYSQALPMYRELGDQSSEARTLSNSGLASSSMGEKQKAIDYDTQALTLYRQLGDHKNEASVLVNIALLYSGLGEKQKAAEFYNTDLQLARASNDHAGEAAAQYALSALYRGLGEPQKSLDAANQALLFYKQNGNHELEAGSLTDIGLAYADMGHPKTALDFYHQALAIQRQTQDVNGEARTLNNLGLVAWSMGERDQALDFHNQALAAFRKAADPDGEAIALDNIGNVYSGMGDKQKGLEFHNQALPLYHAANDSDGEARALGNLGNLYFDLNEKQKALDFYNRALPIFRRIGDRDGVATATSLIGSVYRETGEHQKALEYHNQALALRRAMGDRTGEAQELVNIGLVYADLGDKRRSLENYNLALPIFRQASDVSDEAATLNAIGSIYSGLNEPQKALDSYNAGLAVFRKTNDPNGQAATLNDIGLVYRNLGKSNEALADYNQALPLYRKASNRDGEAATLNNIGLVYIDLGDREKALENLNRALPIAAAVSSPLVTASIFRNLMRNERDARPSLAIFYGKQSVDLVQQVRGNIKNLDRDLQASFLSSRDSTYHDLANLLIDQRRLPEAQQVLDMLKQQEYTDYVRGNKVNPAEPLSLTPAEKQAEEDYQKSTAQLLSVGEQWSALKKIPSRTPEQEQQYQQLSDTLTASSRGLSDYYSRLYVLFGKDSEANKQVADVKGDTAILKQKIAKMPHTVALYTLLNKDRYTVIVISGSAVVAREFLIAEKDLNQKIAAFQQTLRNPASDPRPQAQELYKIIIGPVKADLDQAQAQTLVWSLDGVLRYIPMAALYDGKQYLVENYNIAAFTPASISHLSDKPSMDNISAVAMGISRQYEDDLNPLPTVTGELNSIIKDPQTKDAHGVLPGSILLNGQFTEKAMEGQLSGQHSVVHIASHFVFSPGDDSQSYLLLAGKDEAGTGYHLTVADFRDNQKLDLGDTDLLTLSACETGVGGNAGNGREVDGLATTAQLKGARAVISSLWPVNDSSTGDLMADFYRRWSDGNGKVQKVEALREAQVDLLTAKVLPKPDYNDPNAPTNFSHPYYWAPFILMGNWQ